MNPTKICIYEVDYSVSPGGTNAFEVYNSNFPSDPPIFTSDNLTDAVMFCYNLGKDFSVYTLSSYYEQVEENV